MRNLLESQSGHSKRSRTKSQAFLCSSASARGRKIHSWYCQIYSNLSDTSSESIACFHAAIGIKEMITTTRKTCHLSEERVKWVQFLLMHAIERHTRFVSYSFSPEKTGASCSRSYTSNHCNFHKNRMDGPEGPGEGCRHVDLVKSHVRRIFSKRPTGRKLFGTGADQCPSHGVSLYPKHFISRSSC